MMFLSLSALILCLGVSFTSIQTLTVDTSKSTVEWLGKKVTGSHEGIIQIKSGNLEMTDGILSGGSFVIDMNTIQCTDIKGGGAAKLEGHLKSPDFFGVEKNPTATFKILKVSSRGTEGDLRVKGELNIKEITKEVKFNAQIKNEMGNTYVSADIVIDRTDFDIRYGSGSFFEKLGDKTIYDEFDLKVQLVAR